MKHRSTVVRAAAVLSSMALVAAYVSCRSQSQTQSEPAPQDPPKTFSGSKSAEIFPRSEDRTPPVMSGSKSAAVVTPQQVQQGSQPRPPR